MCRPYLSSKSVPPSGRNQPLKSNLLAVQEEFGINGVLIFRQCICIFSVVGVMFACGQYDFYTKDFIFYRAKLQKPFKKAGQ